MAVDKVDYTNFFRLLSNLKADPTIPDNQLLIPLKASLLDIVMERKEAWTSWVKSYIQELSTICVLDDERKASMNSVNPKYILRNYLCQSAIDVAKRENMDQKLQQEREQTAADWEKKREEEHEHMRGEIEKMLQVQMTAIMSKMQQCLKASPSHGCWIKYVTMKDWFR